MVRPRLRRRICFCPKADFFKPAGIPLRQLEIIEISPDELESLRLQNLLGLDQIQAAKKMHISQPTFHRTITEARKKVTQALVEGKALKLIQQS